MEVFEFPDRTAWPLLRSRAPQEAGSNPDRVRKILKKVKRKGDKALLKYTSKLDGVELEQLWVSAEEISQASALVDEDLRAAILLAKQNLERFHASQLQEEQKIMTMPGIHCWRRSSAIDSVGFYIPGGSAPLFSTVLMLAVPARLAGCESMMICTPPRKDGSIDPAILFAATVCGIDKIAKLGGAQAIAAMAYGTETIPKVKKIFGPGNSFVTLAKQLVQEQGVGIDMPAGPSELLIIADGSADPGFIASDLLSQAEHGPDSQVILLTTDATLPGKVLQAINEQQDRLPRKNISERSLAHSRIILLASLEQALEFSDQYAPEHLILALEDAEQWALKVRTAGSVFLGNYSPEAAGDYASGTNHCLPTNGYAAMYSGVSVDSFVKKISFQQLSREGLQHISSAVMTMAEAEGLDAHRNAIAIRLNKN